MDVAAFPPPHHGKRSFSPLFFQAPSTKRVKYDHGLSILNNDATAPEWMLNTNPTKYTYSDSIFGVKRSPDVDTTAYDNAKRFKQDHNYTPELAEELDDDGNVRMETEQLEDVQSQLLEKDDVLEHILGFVDSISLQTCRGVSKTWQKYADDALINRQLLPEPVRSPLKDHRLVFDAQFRVTGEQPKEFFPRAWNDTANRLRHNLQVEIGNLSWKGSFKSLNLTDAYSNHLVNLITRNLTPCNDGLFHDLKILIERGRVFLKLDNHWLPGTIPVRELAKLLGICRWKGLEGESEVMDEPESMDL